MPRTEDPTPMRGWRLNDHEDVEPFMRWLNDQLNARRTLSLDTETYSVDELWSFRPGRGFCRLWQVGTSTEGWALDAQDWHGLIREAMRRIVDARVDVIFANPKYDQHVFEREGWPIIPWPRVWDVITMHRLSRFLKHSHGLKPAAVDMLGPWADFGQTELKDHMAEHRYDWGTIPTDDPYYWNYGVMDTILTAKLFEELRPINHPWYDVEAEYTRITYGMEKRGLPIDQAKVEYADQVWGTKIDELGEQLRALGIDRPLSPKSLGPMLEALGYTPTEFSKKTGNPSYNKFVMKQIAELPGKLGEIGRLIAEYRTASAWRSNYGVKLLRYMYHGETVVHPSIRDLEARTGRSSIVDPPLQTIPKAAITRDMFLARPGEELWPIDYSSQEIRIQAALSGDPGMLAFFAEGSGDYHTYVAKLAGIPRSAAKVVNYARAYGAGVANLARTAGCDIPTMQGYLNQIDSAFPEAMRWKDRVTAEAERRAKTDRLPWVELPYGMRTVLEADREFTTAANSIIQGHGATVMKLAACRCAAAGYEEAMMLTMHDELIFSFPKGEGAGYVRHCAELMEDRLLQVPLTVEASGPYERWGDKERGKEE